jgi:hypothetical protein
MRSPFIPHTFLKKVIERFSLQLGLLLLLVIIISACTNNNPDSNPVQEVVDEVQPQEIIPPSSEDWTRHDTQGAVEFSVLPLNIETQVKETIDFEIFMNTHSVDLSMDLAALSTLETDLGELIHPVSWSGGTGHHVQGILVFPAQTSSGNDYLEGASLLTLVIRDVDAHVREFTWELDGT